MTEPPFEELVRQASRTLFLRKHRLEVFTYLAWAEGPTTRNRVAWALGLRDGEIAADLRALHQIGAIRTSGVGTHAPVERRAHPVWGFVAALVASLAAARDDEPTEQMLADYRQKLLSRRRARSAPVRIPPHQVAR